MIIAVNKRSPLTVHPEGYEDLIYETFKRITADHPEHEFVFIADKPFAEQFAFDKNVKTIVTGPVAKRTLLWKLWYDVSLPSLLKKNNANVLVSCNGFCSLAAKVPQCLIMYDMAFLHQPSSIKRSQLSFYKKNIPKFLNKAGAVVTISASSKKDIIAHYKIEPGKIDVIFSAAKDIFKPVSEEERSGIKNKYTDGKEYFVHTGPVHPQKNLINLLKAFSVFKKRQQTNMKLLLAGRFALKDGAFEQSLKTYKYRSDVMIAGDVTEEELVKITGAAYGAVYPSLPEEFIVTVLEAMQCNVPVITSINCSIQENAKDAALYIDPDDHVDIAEKMMLLYKDEKLRKELVQKGRQVAEQYNWDKTAELLWQSIIKACQ